MSRGTSQMDRLEGPCRGSSREAAEKGPPKRDRVQGPSRGPFRGAADCLSRWTVSSDPRSRDPPKNRIGPDPSAFTEVRVGHRTEGPSLSTLQRAHREGFKWTVQKLSRETLRGTFRGAQKGPSGWPSRGAFLKGQRLRLDASSRRAFVERGRPTLQRDWHFCCEARPVLEHAIVTELGRCRCRQS